MDNNLSGIYVGEKTELQKLSLCYKIIKAYNIVKKGKKYTSFLQSMLSRILVTEDLTKDKKKKYEKAIDRLVKNYNYWKDRDDSKNTGLLLENLL